MTILETTRLIIRNWRQEDRDLFFEINSDPDVMAFFAFRRSRDESNAMMDLVSTMISETGLGFYCLELKETGEPLGFCGLAQTNLEPFFPHGTIEIGWRMARRHWGKGYASEAAGELLRHGFDTLELPEIVSFAVSDNHRSTAVMKRIGMMRDPARDFDHPRVPDTQPRLKPHVVYALNKPKWIAMKTGTNFTEQD